jgi:glucosamine-6-phosphate deaminase
MKLHVLKTPEELGRKAAEQVVSLLNAAIAEKGSARMIMSTGASQFETIKNLRASNVDWSKVEMFHLDEYIGIDETHPASFTKYLKERFTCFVPLKNACFISGLGDPAVEIARINALITEAPIDAAFIGIGENAHIAFNDPPADFDTDAPFHIVTLNDTCKQQQVREGWFATLDDVPKIAISISPKQIMAAKNILSVVPHQVKAKAIADTMNAAGTDNMVPATLLKEHPAWILFLDAASASLLDKNE